MDDNHPTLQLRQTPPPSYSPLILRLSPLPSTVALYTQSEEWLWQLHSVKYNRDVVNYKIEYTYLISEYEAYKQEDMRGLSSISYLYHADY
jgi:hypothetical protein